jgi:hypothetical protein
VLVAFGGLGVELEEGAADLAHAVAPGKGEVWEELKRWMPEYLTGSAVEG